jgi:hypothetical protein
VDGRAAIANDKDKQRVALVPIHLTSQWILCKHSVGATETHCLESAVDGGNANAPIRGRVLGVRPLHDCIPRGSEALTERAPWRIKIDKKDRVPSFRCSKLSGVERFGVVGAGD